MDFNRLITDEWTVDGMPITDGSVRFAGVVDVAVTVATTAAAATAAAAAITTTTTTTTAAAAAAAAAVVAAVAVAVAVVVAAAVAAAVGGFTKEDTSVGNYPPVDVDDDHLFRLQFRWHDVAQWWHATFTVARRRRWWRRRQYKPSCSKKPEYIQWNLHPFITPAKR